MAENYRRRGKFEEVAFIFPNAPTIPITVVSIHLCPNRLYLSTLTVVIELWNANARLVRYCEIIQTLHPVVPVDVLYIRIKPPNHRSSPRSLSMTLPKPNINPAYSNRETTSTASSKPK